MQVWRRACLATDETTEKIQSRSPVEDLLAYALAYGLERGRVGDERAHRNRTQTPACFSVVALPRTQRRLAVAHDM